jgi:flagellar M-ring protein FliF
LAGSVGSAGSIAAGGQQGSVLGIGHSPGEGVHPEGDEDESLTLSNIQGQMRASSVRKVVSLVDQHPDTTLGIIRGWISADSA